MRYADFRQYRPKPDHNVFVFLCEDEFLVEESRAVWASLFSGNWVSEKLRSKEFSDLDARRLMDEALTPSLFSQSRVLFVMGADKLSKQGLEDLTLLHQVSVSSLKIVLVSDARAPEAWMRAFPVVQIDSLKPGDVARWLMDRYGVSAEIARYLVEAVGTELYPLHGELEKLRTYVGEAGTIQVRDIDALVLRSEQYGQFELDDAILMGNYRRSVQVVGAMLDEGVAELLILNRIVKVWRQLFIGKGLAGKHSAKDVAAAAMIPAFKASEFVTSCKKYEWRQLATGFRELVNADRAFKTSSPNVEAYFDVMLWKLVGSKFQAAG